MTDPAFERDVRRMLMARDPGPAPAELRPAIVAALAAEPGQRRAIAVGRLARAAAGATTIAAALVFGILVSRPPAIGPGAATPPSAGAAYSIRPGDGVVAGDLFPTAQLIAALLAFAVLFVIARTAADRRARLGAALGIALLGLMVFSVGTSDAVAFVGGGSGVVPAGEGPPDEPGMYVSVKGDQPFVIVLTVTNTSRLPLTIEGMPGPLGSATVNGASQPRLIGLGLLARCCDLALLEPFRPTTLEPGGTVDLAIGGLAGACAIPPGVTPSTGEASFEQIRIVYEQLTISHTAAVALPEPVVVSSSEAACP
jgi:hypothetical protein